MTDLATHPAPTTTTVAAAFAGSLDYQPTGDDVETGTEEVQLTVFEDVDSLVGDPSILQKVEGGYLHRFSNGETDEYNGNVRITWAPTGTTLNVRKAVELMRRLDEDGARLLEACSDAGVLYQTLRSIGAVQASEGEPS